jgi:hypothetical protein
MGKTRGRENDTKGKDQKKHMDRSVKESEESLMGIRSSKEEEKSTSSLDRKKPIKKKTDIYYLMN